MKDAIAHCLQKDGLLEEARLPATYQRALLVLTEAPIVPDEVEVEEDLEPVEDEAVPELEDNQFDIEIIQDDFGDRASDDEDAEEEEAKEEEVEEAKEEASHPPKRQRKENTMVGGVRKGKYSKN